MGPLSNAARADYERARAHFAWLRPSDALFELSGEDRTSWLQGQATNDVRGLRPGEGISICLCAPTGQIECVVDAWALEDRILLAAPIETAAAVRERVERMVVLEDVVLSEVTAEYVLISAQGPGAAAAGLEGATRALPNDRTGLGGFDLWLPKGLAAPAPIDPSAAEVLRLEAGLPAPGRDYGPRTLPPELGPQFEASHVSYTKGCYTGQEVLMRIHSRGHTNRTWMALRADAPLAPGDVVRHAAREDAGVVTSAAISPEFGPIGGAMLRRETAEEGARVAVRTSEGEVRAVVATMPLRRR